MSKLDRFLVSDGVISLFPYFSAICLDRHLSDHRPILLRDVQVDFGPTPAFSHSDRNAMIHFKKKLQDLKIIIRQWIKVKRDQLSRSKQNICVELSNVDKELDSGTVSDTPSNEFNFHCGLKQGDPLAPLLFILVMESLHLSISRVVEAGLFKGFWLNSSLSLSYLFYADDALIIGVGVSRSATEVAASTIGCSIMDKQFRYHGIMVGGNTSRHKAWEEVVLKIRSRLSKWKVKTLSIGGRLTLLKSILGASPLYTMSIFKAPKGESNLHDTFPRMFALETDKQSTVAAKIAQDRWVCNASGDGSFRVKDIRNLIDDLILPSWSEPTRWVKFIPIKINIFVWRARRDCLPTRWWDLDWHIWYSFANWNDWFSAIKLATNIKSLLEVMSDASSAVTYTFVYTDSEPWRYYGEESAEAGSPGVIVYEYDGLPMQLVAPPSPDYIPYVPESEYPEDLAPSDDEAPLEDQPLPADASPIAVSPAYVADSDLDEDPKEDPEDDHADYPADGGDGNDEPFDDDDDDNDTDDEDEEPVEDEEDNEEEKEHLAPADSSDVPIVDLILPAEDTEALEADEPTPTPRSPYIIIPLSQTHLRRARKTVRLEPSMSASKEACIARHAALLSPPLPVPSPPLPFPSPLTTSSTDTGAPLGYRVVGIRMRALLPSTSCMTDIPDADVPPRNRACLTTPAPGFEVGESSAAGAARQPGPIEFDLRRYRVKQAGYGITDTWDEIVDTLMEIALTTLKGVGQRVTELDTNTQLTTALGRIEILEAIDPEPQEGPAEAGSSYSDQKQR
nr:RNA-directed DNA polymerase, eukaryota [Tanacetum cinerariifolium]